MPQSGQFVTVLILATLAAAVVSWIVAWRYRTRMKALMRGGDAAAAGHVTPLPPAPAAGLPTQAAVQRAGLRLGTALVALSLLIAASSATLWFALSFPGEPLAPRKVALVALLHAWPMLPALALLWRWRRRTLLLAMFAWCAALFPIVLWRQIEPRPGEALLAMAIEIGPTFVLVAAVFLGRATRAIAPWLLLPAALLVGASHLGLAGMAVLVEHPTPALVTLVGTLGATTTLLLSALAPWLIAWWPMRALGRALARAYARQWFSELLVIFTGLWAFSLFDKAITMVDSVGPMAFAMLLPLAWIPLGALAWRALARPAPRPPTLLVLRVFQQDEQVQALYDHVVERWRLVGNTVMIAGTDLADRTLDADDIFTFLDGRLAERFISAAADVPRRIAAFDMAPDLDGRHRVNECYCRDTTWQEALRTLVSRSDVVLMDLRGFQAHNAGCRFELETLAASPRRLRVVVLVDGRTDRAAARASAGVDTASAPAGRFTWIELPDFSRARRREVMAALCA